jgi:hypothetical protein
MKWILLFIAVNQTPAQLGVYSTAEACRAAIKQIYFRQMVSPGVQLPPDALKSIDNAIELQMKYDRKYECQQLR